MRRRRQWVRSRVSPPLLPGAAPLLSLVGSTGAAGRAVSEVIVASPRRGLPSRSVIPRMHTQRSWADKHGCSVPAIWQIVLRNSIQGSVGPGPAFEKMLRSLWASYRTVVLRFEHSYSPSRQSLACRRTGTPTRVRPLRGACPDWLETRTETTSSSLSMLRIVFGGMGVWMAS